MQWRDPRLLQYRQQIRSEWWSTVSGSSHPEAPSKGHDIRVDRLRLQEQEKLHVYILQALRHRFVVTPGQFKFVTRCTIGGTEVFRTHRMARLSRQRDAQIAASDAAVETPSAIMTVGVLSQQENDNLLAPMLDTQVIEAQGAHKLSDVGELIVAYSSEDSPASEDENGVELGLSDFYPGVCLAVRKVP